MKIKKKNIMSFLTVSLCTIVLLSTIGTSFAQEEQRTQQSRLGQLPWSNNFYTFDSGNKQEYYPVITSSQTFSNSKNLDLLHSFVSNKVVGQDRFRFITSYWTTPDTSNGIDVGTSANNTFLAANSLPPNPKLEVDTNEGYSSLAVALQYQGVVQLAGITAGLKLPIGFKAINSLTSDRNNFDIVLSSYRGNISPGQGVVLYFPMYILPTAKVGLPVLGPLALHFLRTDDRMSSDSISPEESNTFSKTLSLTRTTFP